MTESDLAAIEARTATIGPSKRIAYVMAVNEAGYQYHDIGLGRWVESAQIDVPALCAALREAWKELGR